MQETSQSVLFDYVRLKEIIDKLYDMFFLY